MAGVGTHTKSILGSWHISPQDGCNCEAFAAEWDNRGVAWCRTNHADCVATLAKEAGTRGWALHLVASLGGAAWVVSTAIAAAERDLAAMTADTAAQEAAVLATLEDIRGADQPRPNGWELRPEVVEAHRRLFAEHAPRHHTPPKADGRGVVMLAGGTKYFCSAFIALTRLRELGCRLPVRVCYLGRPEFDHAMEAALRPLDVDCVDLTAAAGTTPRRMGGWEAKVWAIMTAPWREVLYLDADTVPLVDLSELFEQPGYVTAGAMLWPDLPNQWGTDITEAAFRVAGLEVPGRTRMPTHDKPSDYRPTESGQILVDKVRVWDALMLTRHVCDHSEFWFGSPAGHRFWYVYGDKSAFYLGFNATKTPYAMPRDCEWFGDKTGGGFRQFDLGGRPVIEHRCQPTTKVRYRTQPETHGLTHPAQFLAAWFALRANWCGELWGWATQGEEDTAAARTMIGTAWLPFGLPFRERVELQDQGRIRRAPRYRWRVVHDAGQPFLAVADNTNLVAFLGRDDKGNWCDHSRGHFLAPAPPANWDMAPEQFDTGVWSDIAIRNEYRLPDRFEPGAVVVDIGAHCGVFARECLERGADHVVAVECCPENFARLVRNMGQYGDRVTLIHAAAWRSDRMDGWLRLQKKPGANHSGGWSVVSSTDGYLVRTIAFDQILNLAIERAGRVALVKLDCEGAEWPILATSRRLADVDAVAGEYHLALVHDAVEGWNLGELPRRGAADGEWLHWLRMTLQGAGLDACDLVPNVPGLGWFYARVNT